MKNALSNSMKYMSGQSKRYYIFAANHKLGHVFNFYVVWLLLVIANTVVASACHIIFNMCIYAFVNYPMGVQGFVFMNHFIYPQDVVIGYGMLVFCIAVVIELMLYYDDFWTLSTSITIKDRAKLKVFVRRKVRYAFIHFGLIFLSYIMYVVVVAPILYKIWGFVL